MAKKRFQNSAHGEQGGSTAARQAKRELAKATRGMSEEEAQTAIESNPELSALYETSKLMRGNRTGPRPQGLSPYQEEKLARARADGATVHHNAIQKKHEKNIDGKARKAMRTAQEHARGVDVVAAILSLSNQWEFRSGAPDKKISIGADNGHGKLRGVFLKVEGIPPLPKTALSQTGESVVLQRKGDPQEILTIPCLTDESHKLRGAGRKLSRQESEGIKEKIGIHPTDLVKRYRFQFGMNGPE